MTLAAAYYARGTTGWRAYWTLLHPPYTLLHLSFVVVGAALAPAFAWDRLGWTLLAFALAMGVAAHAWDEWNGRPLGTQIDARVLVGLGVLGLVAAVMIGVWGAVHYGVWVGLWWVPVGVLFVLAYNLEWFGGRWHTDVAFALSWGAFPVCVGAVAQGGAVAPLVVVGAAYAFALSLVQRVLSTSARGVRRDVAQVSGTLLRRDGRTIPIDVAMLLAPAERALRLVVASGVLVAVAVLLARAP